MSDASTARARPIDTLLATYAQSHRNPSNESIHIVCVPAIMFTLLGLLWAWHPFVALGVIVLSLAYYAWLSMPFMWGMLLMSLGMLGVLVWLPSGVLTTVCAVVFVLAWIGQFIGHKIEGVKPSFFDDLRYLLIGPLFVLTFAYRRLGIRW